MKMGRLGLVIEGLVYFADFLLLEVEDNDDDDEGSRKK